jgi:hypothetical protein
MNEKLHQTDEIPEDVRAFAREKGVEDRLPAILEMTRQVYPGWEPTLKLVPDPELPESYIVVGVYTAEREPHALLKAQRAWLKNLASICPGMGAYWFTVHPEERE